MFTKNPRERFNQVTAHFQQEQNRKIFEDLRNDLIAGQDVQWKTPVFERENLDTRVIWNYRKQA